MANAVLHAVVGMEYFLRKKYSPNTAIIETYIFIPNRVKTYPIEKIGRNIFRALGTPPFAVLFFSAVLFLFDLFLNMPAETYTINTNVVVIKRLAGMFASGFATRRKSDSKRYVNVVLIPNMFVALKNTADKTIFASSMYSFSPF